ncbi:small ribosomal subunit biogenesis GTPase RsgA 1, mitochondrial-like [Corylus avellana]|uniref:small ribosomal subunit biogenesis GTPase RsgA 1, mitochondrial-like n=1 Tax=Corylus avellana TaxID=13451 RepID=UPI00286D4BC6|nr:small ribosomal subunit biogenesis GTPase RsgA 1, mitochondrial-like [Corylus avellana]
MAVGLKGILIDDMGLSRVTTKKVMEMMDVQADRDIDLKLVHGERPTVDLRATQVEWNALEFDEIAMKAKNTTNGRGKHTTRHVSLLPLSGGGYLADTSGFNQPSLMKVTKQSLAQAFLEIRKVLSDGPDKCSFNDCLHLGELGCIVKADWERCPYYFQLLDEIRIREEFQLRTFGTKREGDLRYKMGDMGVQQAEPRLEPKKHRRKSRKSINQSIIDELDELEDDDDDLEVEK